MTPRALCDWVFEHARRTPDAPAVDSPEHRVTYGLLARRALDLADALGRAGVRANDRVVLALPNLPATVALQCAVQHAGAISVEVSREWSAEQLAIVLEETRPRCIAMIARDARKWAPLVKAAGVRAVVLVHDGGVPPSLTPAFEGVAWIPVTESGELQSTPFPPSAIPDTPPLRDPDSVTLLLYTSGSTGRPRAVMQTIANIAANTRSIAACLELTARDRAMLILPLSYCYGRSVLQTHLFAGGSVFLDPRFLYPLVVLEAIGTEGCTGFAGVPLTFELLRRQTSPDSAKMPSLRYLTQAGGGMDLETADWVRTVFHPASLFSMYGQTEATARLSYLPPERASAKRGSVGIAVPGVELRVVDPDGCELPRGHTGQVVARGPNITPGYYGAPAETARALRGGWLWTGDLGHIDDDGFLFLSGRSKEIMKLGGHRVGPGTIEEVLARHPDVAEVAVAAVRDDLMGEVAGALVVPRAKARPDEQDLRKLCADRLPAFMVPRFVRFASELPRNEAGKVLRQRVAEILRKDETTPCHSRQ